MKKFTAYYFINDLNIVGKEEDFVPYIYDKEKGWVVDKDNILSDRLMGYDGEVIGSSDMLFRVDEISEEKANNLIANM